MSAYEQFVKEKNKLDGFIAQEYRIVMVDEDLDGSWLTMQHSGGEQVRLHLETADARKYFVQLLIQQDAGS